MKSTNTTDSAWKCFGRCGSEITDARKANVEYQYTDSRQKSLSTVVIIHKDCHTERNSRMWEPALAYIGRSGVKQAEYMLQLAAPTGLDVQWLMDGAVARSHLSSWEDIQPERATWWFPWRQS